MLNQTQVRAILDKMETVVGGHFAFGDHHTDQLPFPLRALQQPEYATSLATTLGAPFRPLKVQAVVAPSGTGALLGLELARGLRTRLVVLEKRAGFWAIAPGQEVEAGERVLLATDMLTDETDLPGFDDLVARAGAMVVGCAALIDRTSAWRFPWHLESLLRLDAPLHPAGACPQCRDGEPLSPPVAAPAVF